MTGAREGSKIRQRYRLGFGVRIANFRSSCLLTAAAAWRTGRTPRRGAFMARILRIWWRRSCAPRFTKILIGRSSALVSQVCVFFSPSLPLLFVGVNVALRVLYEPCTSFWNCGIIEIFMFVCLFFIFIFWVQVYHDSRI